MVVFTGPHEHVIGMKARVQNTSEAICIRLDNLSFSMEKDTKPHKACYLNLCLKGHGHMPQARVQFFRIQLSLQEKEIPVLI